MHISRSHDVEDIVEEANESDGGTDVVPETNGGGLANHDPGNSPANKAMIANAASHRWDSKYGRFHFLSLCWAWWIYIVIVLLAFQYTLRIKIVRDNSGIGLRMVPVNLAS